MKNCGPVLLLSILLCAEANIQHVDVKLNGCSASEREEVFGVDGEEEWSTDFTQKKGVVGLPEFADPICYPGRYDFAVTEDAVCKNNLAKAREAYENQTLLLDAPQSVVYPRDEEELGKENSLLCHVSGFHPSSVRIGWTRNGVNVSEGVTTSVPYINQDYTFDKFSRLTFTPEEGDAYTCSVKHRALRQPLTRTWDVEVSQPSIGPAVFCGVGMALGLVGVATGTFFLIKGKQCSHGDRQNGFL